MNASVPTTQRVRARRFTREQSVLLKLVLGSDPRALAVTHKNLQEIGEELVRGGYLRVVYHDGACHYRLTPKGRGAMEEDGLVSESARARRRAAAFPASAPFRKEQSPRRNRVH